MNKFKNPLTEEQINLVGKINDLIERMTEDEKKKVFSIKNAIEYVKQTFNLIEYSNYLRRRGRLPSYASASILESVAKDKGFIYFNPFYIHLSQLKTFLQYIIDQVSHYEEKQTIN